MHAEAANFWRWIGIGIEPDKPPPGPRRVRSCDWTPNEIAAALQLLKKKPERVVNRETGIPRATLSRWKKSTSLPAGRNAQ